MSCLYSPKGTIAELLSESNIQFIAPDYIYDEIQEHFPRILIDTSSNKKELTKILKNITKNVTFYNEDYISAENLLKALELAKDIDIDDTPFIALHLQSGHKLWTGDLTLANGLKKKGYDICITTNELKNYRYKK
ncbi:MAG: PIN domain-containing protein [Bergeyella zoohelcum]|nr:PIN domain-containing protein [Bergeyella zoohelcum]